jgi:hypothetical protein
VGPTRWILRLQQSGGRGYSDDLAARLERIWGITHVVVHSAGIATAEFVKLHPGVVTKPGERVRVHHDALGPFLDAVKNFWRQQNSSSWPGIHCAPQIFDLGWTDPVAHPPSVVSDSSSLCRGLS